MFARYTVFLRDLMENEQSAQELSSALSTYPLYEPISNDSNIPNRSELNQRLLRAYKYREIGFETVGRFLDELETVMCEIMPRYNELYKTVEIMAGLENPFDNVDFVETYQEQRSGTAQTETESSSNDSSNSTVESETHNTSEKSVESFSKKVHSGTPQSELSIPAENIDGVNYADDAEWHKAAGSENESSESTSSQSAAATGTTQMDASGTQTTNESVEHTFTKKGNQGVNTYAHDMIEFRQSIIDVTNQIINDERISELFMRVF